ncbi:MAG: TraB/GumN family protein [Chitinophagaceae bacterium]|nr:TraB/GumN family protein [Chitinophagaceae bacterium]
MRKGILFLAGFFTQLFSMSLFAQKAEVLPKADQNSLLWKITGNGLQKPSYLFGTIHMICSGDYFFDERMKQAFNETEQLILEINLSDPATIAQYQQGMMLPAGKELKDFFNNAEEYETFSVKLKNRIGIDAALFQNLKPLILLSLIAQKGFECENTSSYEMNLIEMSKEKNMPVTGLETTLAQMKIFDEMKDSEISQILIEGIEDLGNDSKLQQQMIAAYRSQNISELHDLILSSKEFQNQEDVLINGRNREWVKKMPQFMKAKSCFVAVGAGHLSGEQGVLNLLRNAGYVVEPVGG